MQLCCMPRLTCFYNSFGFTFAFKMFMFILISNSVYSMIQPPFSVYFISCSIPIPFLFILSEGQSEINGCVLRRARLRQRAGTQSGLFQKGEVDLGPRCLSLLFLFFFSIYLDYF